ncbi:LysR family transcriptional regulator [Thiofilum flexile]|uniref:LysR family transcriptional regulator n=1 Tax=Thiofilum flexile TaxID=125627 RepID=UPI00036F4A18|nr:LysR family transcriptional regulator [Thiofilum flexile]
MTIPSHLLAHLPYFAAVSRFNSFTLAAEYLHVSPSAISYQIRQLEDKLEVSLVLRQSGSKLNLTTAGKALAQAYQQFEQGLEQVLVQLQPSHLSGRVQMTAPVDFASRVLPYVLAELKSIAPNLVVELEASDALRDLIQDGFDLAIRSEPNDERLRHKVLLQVRKSVVASPAYIQHYGVPKLLSELDRHTLLVRGLGQYTSWKQLLALQNLEWSEGFNTLILGNSFALEEGAKAGLGLALLADFVVADALERGELVQIMPHLTQSLSTTFYVSFAPTPQARVYVEVLQQALKQVLEKRFMGALLR